VGLLLCALMAIPAAADETATGEPVPDARLSAPLTVPASGEIKVAFLISPGAEIVDFGGPWGVFEYAYVKVGGEMRNPFKLYTVAASRKPVMISGGMSIVPNYSFKNAPPPDLIVVPALDLDRLAPAALNWLKSAHRSSAVTMSVCNGSFVLGKAGLLEGRRATSHHGGYGLLRAMADTVTVVRGARYVEDGKIATSGGLTSGIDLALRVVERYFGRELARETARRLEYQGTGWMYPDSNADYLQPSLATSDEEAIDPVCEVAVPRSTSPRFDYKGKTYYFNCDWCKGFFTANPGRFAQ
jgi:putative intracellular protease/amidase/YHS domain-containing protein